MFERFTDESRRALFFSRYEASQMGSASIDAEHLLLGVIAQGEHEPRDAAALVFAQMGIPLGAVRTAIETRTTSRGNIPPGREIPFSEAAKRVLMHAAAEAERLQHDDISTEHLLLGVLCEEGCMAASVLLDQGMQIDKVRAEVVRQRGPRTS